MQVLEVGPVGQLSVQRPQLFVHTQKAAPFGNATGILQALQAAAASAKVSQTPQCCTWVQAIIRIMPSSTSLNLAGSDLLLACSRSRLPCSYKTNSPAEPWSLASCFKLHVWHHHMNGMHDHSCRCLNETASKCFMQLVAFGQQCAVQQEMPAVHR